MNTTTNNTTTEAKNMLPQRTKNALLKAEVNKIFEQVTQKENYFICPLIDERQKTKQIQQIKSFCNVNFDLYQVSIIFVGGINLDYTTALKIQVIE